MKARFLPPPTTVACLAFLAGIGLSQGASVSLKTTDAGGSSSFTGATNWTINAVPNATNDYFTSSFALRTPPDAVSYTFGGNSLTLQPGTTSGYSILEKSSAASGAGRTLTINNFTNAGGLLRSGGTVGSIITITGNVFAISANSTLTADQCNWIINSPLAGSGDLTCALDVW